MNVKAERKSFCQTEIQTRSFNLVGAQVSPMNELWVFLKKYKIKCIVRNHSP